LLNLQAAEVLIVPLAGKAFLLFLLELK